jgi:hypothetical protein
MSIKLTSASVCCGDADTDSDGLGEGELLLALGDIEVEGF